MMLHIDTDGINGVMKTVSPNNIPSTGDDSPASSVWAYIWRMSGRHQVAIGFLAVLVALGGLAPIELQRRIIDTAIETGDVDALFRLGMIMLALLLVFQALKFALRLYQGWISESAILYTRRHLLGLYGERAMEDGKEESGTVVSIVSTEIDKLGGFVGEGPSQAISNVAILIGSIAYMLIVEPTIALVGLAVLIPQIILTPLLQSFLNALVEKRVKHMRNLSRKVPEITDQAAHYDLEVLPEIYRNRLRFFFVKFGMKALLNLLNGIGPLVVLIYGGWLAIQGETSVGVIVAFLAGFERVSAPLRELIAFYRQAEQARVQHDMVADWIEKSGETDEGSTPA